MTFSEIAVRFMLGGAIVSVFAMVGEIWKPKTFGGLFGSAPSVAIASLALAFAKDGSDVVVREARSMTTGSVGLVAYAFACAHVARSRIPVWLAAILAWFLWAAVVGVLAVARGD